MPEKFTGFDAPAFDFIAQLRVNNERAWFDAHKDEYVRYIAEPSKLFLKNMTYALREQEESLSKIGGKTMRIYRDVRFSKDKTPYKPRIAFRFGMDLTSGFKGRGPIFYIHLDEAYLGFFMGIHTFHQEKLTHYRVAVDDERRGGNLVHIMDEFSGKGIEFIGDHYVRLPKGYDKGHPREVLLKRKGLMSKYMIPLTDCVYSDDLIAQGVERFMEHKPLYDWLSSM